MCMYVSEICAEGIFVTFPWWLKNVKSRSKIAPFSNEHHFEIWFPKKRTITFFWSKLFKLHKKDPILHVATTFSLKQGETRTSHGPIPHPLKLQSCPTSLLFWRIYIGCQLLIVFKSFNDLGIQEYITCLFTSYNPPRMLHSKNMSLLCEPRSKRSLG